MLLDCTSFGAATGRVGRLGGAGTRARSGSISAIISPFKLATERLSPRAPNGLNAAEKWRCLSLGARSRSEPGRRPGVRAGAPARKTARSSLDSVALALALPLPLPSPHSPPLAPEDLDVLQIALASTNIQDVLNRATGTDLQIATRIESLIRRGYLIVG